MKTFKTKAGTELPLLNLKGKDYLQVAHRIQWFREEHPNWTIKTEIIHHDEKRSVVKADIGVLSDSHHLVLIASAHKTETAQGFGDHLEKAETGAVGRALAMCGYGTQFTTDLDEGERLADAPLQRAAHEIKNVTRVPLVQASGLKPIASTLENATMDLVYETYKVPEG